MGYFLAVLKTSWGGYRLLTALFGLLSLSHISHTILNFIIRIDVYQHVLWASILVVGLLSFFLSWGGGGGEYKIEVTLFDIEFYSTAIQQDVYTDDNNCSPSTIKKNVYSPVK